MNYMIGLIEDLTADDSPIIYLGMLHEDEAGYFCGPLKGALKQLDPVTRQMVEIVIAEGKRHATADAAARAIQTLLGFQASLVLEPFGKGGAR